METNLSRRGFLTGAAAAGALAAAVCHANLTRTKNLGKARSFQQ